MTSPPEHISDTAKEWWDKIVIEYCLTDSASLLVLQTALEAYDRNVEARRLIENEGPVITDRFNQKKPHPACVIERDSRSALVQSLKSLGLKEIANGFGDESQEKLWP